MSFALPQLPWITLSIQANASWVNAASLQRVLTIAEQYVAGADLRYRLETGDVSSRGLLELVASPAEWMIANSQSSTTPAVIYHRDETLPIHIGLLQVQGTRGDRHYRLNISIPRKLELQTVLENLLFDTCETLHASWGRYLPPDMQSVVLDLSGRGPMQRTENGLQPLNSHADLLRNAPWLASLAQSAPHAAGSLADELGWKNYLANDIAGDVMTEIDVLDIADGSLVRKGNYGIFFSFGHGKNVLENQKMAALYISAYKRLAFGTRND